MTAFSPQRLREARTAAMLTPEHIAVAVGRTWFTVRAWEAGKVTPPTPILSALADALGCPLAALFEGGAADAA